jgi:hypothetical protein
MDETGITKLQCVNHDCDKCNEQHKWVGLTDEDFQPMVQKAMVYYGYDPEHSTLTSGAGFYALVRDIEAKLRSKNNG